MSKDVFSSIISNLEKHGYVFNVDKNIIVETIIPSIFSSITAGLVMYHDSGDGHRWPCIDGIRLSLQECPYCEEEYSFGMCAADDGEETSEELLSYIIAASRSNTICIAKSEIIRIVIKCAYDWMIEYDCGIRYQCRPLFHHRYTDSGYSYIESEYMHVQHIIDEAKKKEK